MLNIINSRRVVLGLLMLASGSVFAADSEVFGGVKGNLSVTPGGEAKYSVPVELPKTPGGFVPDVRIEYSQNVDDGELGVGFSLKPSSQISRCPQTYAQDGKAGQIKYDESEDATAASGITDRFCLDGSRLVVVAGKYGFDASEYRTEIDTFRKIIYRKPSGVEPYFEVKTKDGRTLVYGKDANAIKKSTVFAEKRRYAWLLRSETDRSGNYTEYEYLGASVVGQEHLLKQIRYGGRSSDTTKFIYKIDFSYDDRADAVERYSNGLIYKNGKQLKTIGVAGFADTAAYALKKYVLSYETGVSSGRSRISTIKQCMDDGTKSANYQCLQPVSFAWTDKSSGGPVWQEDAGAALPQQLYSANGNEVGKGIKFVDLNGDGLTDMIWQVIETDSNGGDARVVDRGALLKTTTGWQDASDYLLPNTPTVLTAVRTASGYIDIGSEFVDVNGDGLLDFLYATKCSLSCSVRGAYLQRPAPVNGSRWENSDAYFPPSWMFDAVVGGNLGVQLVDVNGDGLPDFLQRTEGLRGDVPSRLNNSAVYINTPSVTGAGYSIKWVKDSTYELPFPLYRNVNDTAVVWQNYVLTKIVRAQPRELSVKFIDVNGDGLSDMLYYRAKDGVVEKGAYINNQYAAGTENKWKLDDRFVPPLPLYYDIYTDTETRVDSTNPNMYWFDVPYLELGGDLGARFVDLNGDGLSDLLYSRFAVYDEKGNKYLDANGNSAARSVSKAYLNNGAGWVEVADFKLPTKVWDPVAYNLGKPLIDIPPQTEPLWLSIDGFGDLGRYFVDVNGDGLVDFLYHWQQKNLAGNMVTLDKGAYLNTGKGWKKDDRYAPPYSIYSTQYRYWGSRIDDFNGDGIADIAYHRDTADGFKKVTYINPTRVDLLKHVSDGFGAQIEIDFKSIADRSVYPDVGSAGAYPDIETVRPAYVVSQIRNKLNSQYLDTSSYQYYNLKANLNGRGLIGFGKVKVERTFAPITESLNQETQYERVVTTYSQKFPYYGMVIAEERAVKSGAATWAVVSKRAIDESLDLTFSNPKPNVYFPYAKKATDTSYDMGTGHVLSTAEQTFSYDDYGNLTANKAVVKNGAGDKQYTTDVVSAYKAANETSWLVDLLETKTTTFQRTGVSDIVRKSKYTYYASGLLQEEIQQPDESLYESKIAYEYGDGFGNVTKKTISGAGEPTALRSGITARSETYAYEAKAGDTGYVAGTFLTKKTNAKLHATAYVYQPLTGQVVEETDPNSISLAYDRNVFGLLNSVTRKQGEDSTIRVGNEYAWCDATCQANESYFIKKTEIGRSAETLYFDGLGRQVRKTYSGYGTNNTLVEKTLYDKAGRVVCASKPMSSTVTDACDTVGTNYWTRFAFDALGRQAKKREPGSRETTWAYNDDQTVVTNPRSQTRTERRNPKNEVVDIVDNLGKKMALDYDAAGNLVKTTDPKSNVISFAYDKLGRKTSMTDPDMGAWSYDYNVIGELIRQKNANAQTTELYYDELSRLTKREEPSLKGEWVYDTATNGLGKLHYASAVNGYKKTLEYNIWGLTTKVTTRIDVSDYVISQDYDEADRSIELSYPTGVGYKSVYDADGYLTEVKNRSDDALLWKADVRDNLGRVTKETLGKDLISYHNYKPDTDALSNISTGKEVGTVFTPTVQNETYNFDALKNLKYRNQVFDAVNLVETFDYDALNRVEKITNVGVGEKRITYDEIGNITDRSDAGSYGYQGCGGVHRVCSVQGQVAATFTYDSNGNMKAGNGHSFQWSSFNMPELISGANGSSEAFTYSPDYERVRRTSIENDKTTTELYLNPRIDLGGTYERVTKPDNTVEHTHHVYAGGSVIGALVSTGSATSGAMRYFHGDHQGSIVAVTDAAGNVIERLSYDAWGKRRSPDGSDEIEITSRWKQNPALAPTTANPNSSGITLPTTDPYGLVQWDAANSRLVFHTRNKLKTSPQIQGQTLVAGDKAVRLLTTFSTPAQNASQRNFHVSIANTGAPGTAAYRRYGLRIKGAEFFAERCIGDLPCETTSIGSVKNDVVYKLELLSSVQSGHLKLQEVAAPANVLYNSSSVDWLAGDATRKKTFVSGVTLSPRILVLGPVTAIIPIWRPDSLLYLQGLELQSLVTKTTLRAYSTRHGYTLHEHLDSQALIHMNGRVYDPVVGRFTSADPNVVYPDNIQDYNRYSYVWNNPLSFTDPDGFAVDCVNCATGSADLGFTDYLSLMVTNGRTTSFFGVSSRSQMGQMAPGAIGQTSASNLLSDFLVPHRQAYNNYVAANGEVEGVGGGDYARALLKLGHNNVRDFAVGALTLRNPKLFAGLGAAWPEASLNGKELKAAVNIEAASAVLPIAGVARPVQRVAKGAEDWAKLSGQLRTAAKGKGNFGIGSGTREQADAMGKAWVGDGYNVASDGKTLISADGLRQYRPPSYKPRLDKTQANFEQRFAGQKSNRWQSNAHLDVTD